MTFCFPQFVFYMDWNQQNTSQLIELYRLKPVLWNPQHEAYKVRNIRHQALNEISSVLDVPKEEVERKLRNLVGQFSREIKKLKEKKQEGEKYYESTWYAFRLLLFLKDKIKPRSKKNDDESDSHSEFDEYFHEEVLDASSILQKPVTFKRKRCPDLVDELGTTTNISASSDDKRGKDEYDLFGELVAVKMRKLPTNRIRSNVQHLINTVLWEAEVGKYDNYGASSFSSLNNHLRDGTSIVSEHMEDEKPNIDHIEIRPLELNN